MKTFVRALWGNDPQPLWDNEEQRESLRRYLNDGGFYVLTGAGDSLEVYALEYHLPWDIRAIKKALDNLAKLWYLLKQRTEVIK